MFRTDSGLTITEVLALGLVALVFIVLLTPARLSYPTQDGSLLVCAANMRQIHLGVLIYEAQNDEWFPQCFDLRGDSKPGNDRAVDESTWWYRRVADLIHCPHWSAKSSDVKRRPRDGEACVLRCPDGSCEAVGEGSGSTGSSRDYVGGYGFNNWGFRYSSVPGRDGGAMAGRFEDGGDWTHIGQRGRPARPTTTVLLMDYGKADVAPVGGSRGSYSDGDSSYRFRHEWHGRSRANVLFVDGHVEAYTAAEFAAKLDEEDMAKSPLHFRVVRRP